MSEEDISVIETAETSRNYVKSAKADDTNKKTNKYKKLATKNDGKPKKSLLRRLPSVQTALTISYNGFRRSCRKLNCFKNNGEEEMPMMELPPRHRSIDIGVSLRRRMSLFLFTKRTVSVHPYHPYTPQQTTRKIYVFHEDK
ncbi:unnamed protein product [Chrysodeixis includens]|uniref:Uncharacterized protein n=1 Tax=Chrysodeixis includens TaxID=689277 RepID=A0A9P0BN08_CHRIL|nr:unnamed protein product [Chrysodeixis includens]